MKKNTRSKNPLSLVVALIILTLCYFVPSLFNNSEAPIAVDPPVSQTDADIFDDAKKPADPPKADNTVIDEDGYYYTKDDVALYIHTYNHLPGNYITKALAQDAGWVAEKGNLWQVTDRMIIGGDVYRNYEKRLPSKEDRTWYECDVNYTGGYRNDERIVFSDDGLIYYTDNHYRSFKKLYGD